MLVAKNWWLFLQKNSVIDTNWQVPQYAPEGIFPLSIYLGDYFKFRISRLMKLMFAGIQNRNLWRVFLCAEFEQIGLKILSSFRKI